MEIILKSADFSGISIGKYDRVLENYLLSVGVSTYKAEIATFINALKTAGVYDKLDNIYIPYNGAPSLDKIVVEYKSAINNTVGGENATVSKGLSIKTMTTPIILDANRSIQSNQGCYMAAWFSDNYKVGSGGQTNSAWLYNNAGDKDGINYAPILANLYYTHPTGTIFKDSKSVVHKLQCGFLRETSSQSTYRLTNTISQVSYNGNTLSIYGLNEANGNMVTYVSENVTPYKDVLGNLELGSKNYLYGSSQLPYGSDLSFGIILTGHIALTETEMTAIHSAILAYAQSVTGLQ